MASYAWTTHLSKGIEFLLEVEGDDGDIAASLKEDCLLWADCGHDGMDGPSTFDSMMLFTSSNSPMEAPFGSTLKQGWSHEV